MANLNRIILIGRLTNDPEIRFTVEGTAMAKFNLAVKRFAGAGGQDATDYIDIVAWQKVAEACGELLKKGSLCLIEGRIQVRQFEIEGGKKRYATEVVASKMRALEPKKVTTKPAEAAPPPSDNEIFEAADDLPF